MRYVMRTMHSPISDTTGCSASTALGTFVSCAISTMTAPTTPATKHAIVSRFTSPNPEKRHIPFGTPSATKMSRYNAINPSITQMS